MMGKPGKIQRQSSDSDQEEQHGLQEQSESRIAGNWATVQLPELRTPTGEQGEEELYCFSVKVYRWRGEWKGRGKGILKILKDPNSNRIRIVARAEKTYRCFMNHYLQKSYGYCSLRKLKTCLRAYAYMAYDFSEGEPKHQILSVRLADDEDQKNFLAVFEGEIGLKEPQQQASDLT